MITHCGRSLCNTIKPYISVIEKDKLQHKLCLRYVILSFCV